MVKKLKPEDPSKESENEKITFRRVNITIREDQYNLMISKDLALSGLIRDLLDDRFASNKIILQLSPQGKKLYDTLVSNFGLHDSDLEDFFITALDRFLGDKLKELNVIRQEIKNLQD